MKLTADVNCSAVSDWEVNVQSDILICLMSCSTEAAYQNQWCCSLYFMRVVQDQSVKELSVNKAHDAVTIDAHWFCECILLSAEFCVYCDISSTSECIFLCWLFWLAEAHYH